MPDPRQEENKRAEKERREAENEKREDARRREIDRIDREINKAWEAKRNLQQDSRKGWSTSNFQFENLDEIENINNQTYEENYNNPKNNKEKSKFEWEELEFEENLNF